MRALILCYHKVGSISEEGRRLNIEPHRLASHIRHYVRKETPFLRASEFASHPYPEGVCFTFDDAYESTLRNAPPLFERYGVRASFFAVWSKLGGPSDWDMPFDRPLATLEALKEASRAGHEIGNHTLRHLRLSGLSEEHQQAEIGKAHEALLDAGLNPQSLCYPYGAFDRVSLEVGRSLGYRVGLSLKKGPVRSDSDPLALPRVVLACSDTLPMLIYKTRIRPRLRGR